jgi:gamma-glutamyltranspeptidase/glutathione hydrolase
MYLDSKGAVIKDASVIGPRAAGVPGTVAGLWLAHQRFGTRPWRELLQPAIRLARDGFVPSKAMASNIQEAGRSFKGVTNFDKYFGAVTAGKLFRQPELATLTRIASGGRWSSAGQTAQLVAEQMSRGGLITLKDMAGYKAKWREPLTADWRGMTLRPPLPSSGGFA